MMKMMPTMHGRTVNSIMNKIKKQFFKNYYEIFTFIDISTRIRGEGERGLIERNPIEKASLASLSVECEKTSVDSTQHA